MEKVPYMFVVGDKERDANKVAIRKRKDGDIGAMDVEEAVSMIVKERDEKAL